MKIPTRCPKCDDVLLTEPMFNPNKVNIWRKVCNKRIGHQFSVFFLSNETDVKTICVEISKDLTAYWELGRKLLTVSKENVSIKKTLDSTVFIPFFEPDLSDYDGLVSKIKTYIIFS